MKKDQQTLEQQYRAGERDQMLRAVDYKNQQDRSTMENYRNQQRMFGEQAQNMIDQRNRQMADMKNNESMADKAFIENNNQMARAMADQKAMIKKTQQQVLRDGNLEMMRMRKEMEQNDVANRREKASTTIGPVGDGYQQQLANMQRAD